jgi:general secretion pathway protein H
MALRQASGFTLFELIVVLVIMGIFAVATAPMVMGGLTRIEARTAARDLATSLRRARGEAIAENIDVALSVDTAERVYALDGGKPHRLPAGLEVALLTAETERINQQAGRIRFFADGSSTGGTVTLADAGNTYRVQVDWLTGRVRVVEGGEAP